MTICAVFCGRGPKWSTGILFVRGSMASERQSTCVELQSLVRSSSSWRCGSCRVRKKRSCKVLACKVCARQPDGAGRLPVAEDTPSFGRVQPFDERRQHHCDLPRGG